MPDIKAEIKSALDELIQRFESTIPTPSNHRGESTMRIEHFVDLVHEAKKELAALRAPAADPIGWVYQHEETGRMTFCENDGINTPEIFQKLNPRFILCGPAYTTPPVGPQLAQEIASHLNLMRMMNGAEINHWPIASRLLAQAFLGKDK